MKIKVVLIFLGIILTLIFGFLGKLYILSQQDDKIHALLKDRVETAKVQQEVLSRGYKQYSTFIFDQCINKGEIVKMMYDAVNASKDSKKRIRKKLLEQLLPLYQRMKAEHIRQLHFHLPDAISFLRFHKPSKFGDDLSSVRPSIVKVNETKKMVAGFEEGRAFNGIRHVFPLFYHNTFVGTVEITYNFFAYMNSSVREDGEHFYHAILHKSNHDNKVWESEKGNYVTSKIDPHFIYDKAVYEQEVGKNGFPIESKGHFLEKMASSFTNTMKSMNPSSHELFFKGEYYSVVFYPIENILGEKVAYFITIKKDLQLKLLKEDAQKLIELGYLTSMAVASLLVMLFATLYHRFYWLKQLAEVDQLTQVANRTYCYSKMKEMLAYAKKHRAHFSMIFFDIDHFKSVNDTFGHDVGDVVLKTVAKLVGDNLREGDLLGRWGGEEFMILLANSNLEQAHALAEKLRKLISEYPFEHGTLSCSFGVVEADAFSDDKALIKEVDVLLYEAKELGRNIVVSEQLG